MNTETPNRGPNPAQMKAVGLKISFMMALWMSFTLSIFGTATAERPAGMPLAPIIIGWFGSFVLSFVVSFGIGFIVLSNCLFCIRLYHDFYRNALYRQKSLQIGWNRHAAQAPAVS